MWEKALKPPPGFVGFRRVLSERPYTPRPKKTEKKVSKTQRFRNEVMTKAGSFTTADFDIDKRRSSNYLADMVAEGLVRILPNPLKVPGICRPMIQYEVIRDEQQGT